ncbi:NOS1 [Mytilus edulis]|uniref:nitric-oxide synthase (NADPH) n=1 Tax=Mytilus edulis TaxID=6550 RepID=A0A8S3VEG2_MYTED|nr:NOS1 [Mytilus edulis]
MESLGATRIYSIGEGDELCGQEEAFKTWAKRVYQVACGFFNVGNKIGLNDASEVLEKSDTIWRPETFRVKEVPAENRLSLGEGNHDSWNDWGRYPPCTLTDMITRYLDISTPSSQQLLNILSSQAVKTEEKFKIKRLINAAVFSESRRYCDQLFRGDMLSICSKKFLTRRICRAFAHLYYVGVRVGGKSRYHEEKSADCEHDWIKSCIV